MNKNDIEVGKTYLFTETLSPKRKHLEGKPFTVVEKKKVYRKTMFKRGGKRTVKTWRFFNDEGVGARADELGELPAGMAPSEQYKCPYCGDTCKIEDLHVEPGNEEIHNVCPSCGHTAQVFNQDLFAQATHTWPIEKLAEAYQHPAVENEVFDTSEPGWNNNWAGGNNEDEYKDRGYGFCPKCQYPLTNWGAGSDGDGDIYDEIGCDRCEETIRKEHASYCTCSDCNPDAIELDADMVDGRDNPCPECETGEVKFVSTDPGGSMKYKCTDCSYNCTFP